MVELLVIAAVVGGLAYWQRNRLRGLIRIGTESTPTATVSSPDPDIPTRPAGPDVGTGHAPPAPPPPPPVVPTPSPVPPAVVIPSPPALVDELWVNGVLAPSHGVDLTELPLQRGRTGVIRYRVRTSEFGDPAARATLKHFALNLAGTNASLPGTYELYARITKLGGLPRDVGRVGSPQLEFVGHSHRINEGEAEIKGIDEMMEKYTYAIIIFCYGDGILDAEIDLKYKVIDVDDPRDEMFSGTANGIHGKSFGWRMGVEIE